MIAGVLLILVGMSKVFSITSSEAALLKPDAIFGIQYKQMMLLLGPLEIVIGLFCVANRRQWLLPQAAVVSWLGLNFALYRFGRWWLGVSGWCGCLGNPADVLNLTDESAEALILASFVYLLVAGFGSLLILHLSARKNRLEHISSG